MSNSVDKFLGLLEFFMVVWAAIGVVLLFGWFLYDLGVLVEVVLAFVLVLVVVIGPPLMLTVIVYKLFGDN